jgi:hypothetical protein
MAQGVGIVPHTGWAWLVRVGGQPVRVEARLEVVACDVLEGELFHLAAERSRDRADFLGDRRARAAAQAIDAVRAHVAGAKAAIVLGKRFAIDDIDRIVAAHPMVHAAEGELWRALFAEACEAAGLRVARREADAVRASLEEKHGAKAVAAFLAASREIVGPPWSKEPQEAALAAWAALSGN